LFQTDHSDTEVLLQGWREWGPALAHRLEGMYAFALWDRSAGELIIGRDWFGQKPLYVAHAELSADEQRESAENGRHDLTVVSSDPLAVARVIDDGDGPAERRSASGMAGRLPPPWLRLVRRDAVSNG
jgi:asparagine synthase (glutamine-hydrolysing)